MILKRYSQTAALFSFESLLRLRAAPGLRERSPAARKGGDRSASRGERFS